MKLPEIRAALIARAMTVPGIVAGYATAPTQLGDLPCAVVFHDPDQTSTITMGASEMWTHRLMLRLYVAPVKNIPDELDAADQFIEPLVAAIRQQYQLGVAGVYGASVTGYRVGTSPYGGADYVVAEWLLDVKAKQATEVVA